MPISEVKDHSPCVCICDREISYALRLAEYLKSRNKVAFEVHVYSSWEKLLEMESARTAALVVVAQSQFAGEVEAAGFHSLLLLCEDEQLREEPVNMSKYQSMEVIAQKIQELCLCDDENLPSAVRHGRPMKLIGVYSPLTRCLKTTFSLCMGQLLAQRGPALYLNFEAYSGLGIMLERDFRGSISDLLYYNDCAREKLSAQLSMMTEKLGELDFLPPMESWISLSSVRAQQWLALLSSIEKVTQYEYCILDLSEHVDGLFEILRRCGIIYTITRQDSRQDSICTAAKIRQYEQLLADTNHEDILIKTRRVCLPVFRTLPADPAMLTRGELGSYVEQLIAQEEML